MLLVSACLAGEPCRYDGKANTVPVLAACVRRGEAVPVCPEVLGGLPTPRVPSERLPDGRVVNAAGEDVTAQFTLGARRALAVCRARGCSAAVLKARSPSCGKGCIYDGSFTHTRVPGDGVFAALLREAGIPVRTEEEYLQAQETCSEQEADTMTQIERIQHYETLLDRVDRANDVLARALEAFEKAGAFAAELEGYLGSETWMQDFEDDEAGRLPQELKRGVLSEDGIYCALEERRQLLAELLETVARTL